MRFSGRHETQHIQVRLKFRIERVILPDASARVKTLDWRRTRLDETPRILLKLARNVSLEMRTRRAPNKYSQNRIVTVKHD